MIFADDKHFYKVDGEFILIANEIAMAVKENQVLNLMLASSKLYEKMKKDFFEEIK